MTPDLKKFLQYSDFYNLLSQQCDDKTCNLLIDMLDVVELKTGDVLFKEGEMSDSLFILVEGLLGAEIHIDGKEKLIGTIRSGQSVGEMGVIASQPRTSTVKALRHSFLLKLTKDVFDNYFITQPKVLLNLLHTLISRSTNTLHAIKNVYAFTTMAFIMANESIRMDDFFDKLVKLLQKSKKIQCLSTDHYQQVDDGLIKLVEDAERNNDFVIYKINPTHIAIAEFFLSRTERVFVVADGTMITPVHDSVLALNENIVKRELILLYPKRMHSASINALLKTMDFFRYHHISMNDDNDCARLVRFITGKAFGLVLSGGGTRGWVHAGALKALEEAKINIDVIGGTSIGAVIGAKYLLENDFAKFEQAMLEYAKMNAHPYRITNLTFPLVSILNGKNLTQATQNLFGHERIEHLWKPFFCVTCDMNQSLQKVNYQGPLSLWTRASSSIPGIVPPVTHNGKMYVDGAVINNLPTDVMREYLDGGSKIVAIDLSYSHDENNYNFPPVINFFEAILIKLKIKFTNYKLPRIHDLMMRSRIIGTSEKITKNCLQADILIRPDLSNYGLLTETKHTNELFQLGYNLMQEKIPDLQRLLDS